VTPADLKALLEKASPRPWVEHFEGRTHQVIAIGDTDGFTVGLAHSIGNGEAILALVNLAPLLIELWEAMEEDDMPPTPRQRATLAKLEDS
jgi:hypothetical protein